MSDRVGHACHVVSWFLMSQAILDPKQVLQSGTMQWR